MLWATVHNVFLLIPVPSIQCFHSGGCRAMKDRGIYITVPGRTFWVAKQGMPLIAADGRQQADLVLVSICLLAFLK